MLDDIREWISDNLRYILLVLAGIVLIFLIVSGVRLIRGGSSPKNKKAETSQTAETSQSVEASQTEETGASTEAAGQASLTETDDQTMITLIKSYYQALAAKDVETVRVLTDQLTSDEETAIQDGNDVQSYSDLTVYTVPGLQENTWVVYAKYNCQYANFDTAAPGLSRLYVCTADDGSYYISNGTVEESVQQYIEALQNNTDVSNLVQSVQAEYEAALAADTSLASYLENKDQSASNALYEADGTELTIKQTCNVRAGASTSTEKLGQLTAGTTVVKEGSEAEWIKITYEGQTAYVRWDMFE